MDEKSKSSILKQFNLPESVDILRDYSCALEKTILVQGTMYITKEYILFYSSVLLGKKVAKCIPISEIASLEKKKTAFTIPNAIEIRTKSGDKYFFASFMHRDETFAFIQDLVNATSAVSNISSSSSSSSSSSLPSPSKEQTEPAKDPSPPAAEETQEKDSPTKSEGKEKTHKKKKSVSESDKAEKKKKKSEKSRSDQRGSIHLKISYSKGAATPLLNVQVIEAKDLVAVNSDEATSDPYVTVKFGSKEKKTKTVKKELNPTWNESFEFKAKDQSVNELSVTVWDWNMLSSAVFMGQTKIEIPFAAFEKDESKVIDEWYPLYPENYQPSRQSLDAPDTAPKKKRHHRRSEDPDAKTVATESADSTAAATTTSTKESSDTNTSAPAPTSTVETAKEQESKVQESRDSENEKLIKEQKENEQEVERLASEQKEKENKEKEQREREQKEKEQREREQKEKEQKEREQREREQKEREQREREQKEKEQKEKEEREQKEKEQKEKEKADKEKESREAKEKEAKEKEQESQDKSKKDSKKENKSFHKHFDLPNEEPLDEFSCALDKGVPHRGTLYVTPNYICFYSPLFNKAKECIPVKDITSVEKKKTAKVVPNAIQIIAAGQKYFFHSFISRDAAYETITKLVSPDATAKERARESRSVSGFVNVKLRYIPADADTSGVLYIDVIDAKGLAPKDRNGLSDPFVILKLDGEEAKTQVVKNSLNPVYNEHFELKVKPNSNLLLKVTVFDWNQLTLSEFMGQRDIDIEELPHDKELDFSLELLSKDEVRRVRKNNIEEKRLRKEKLEAERKELELANQAKKEQEQKQKQAEEQERIEKEKLEIELKKKKKEELKAYLDAHPQEKRLRTLQKQFKFFSNIFVYLLYVFTWRRPVDFGALAAVVVGFIGFMVWMDMTVLGSTFFTCAVAVWMWWLSEVLHINVPWTKLLGEQYDTKEPFEFAIYITDTATDSFHSYKTSIPMLTAAFLALTVIGLFVNGYILLLLTIIGVLVTPGMLYKKYKQHQLQQASVEKKTN